MAVTSLNPGVGPTNADIATAVAAPSAATIATAVAAAVPTTAGITSIVQSNSGAYNGTWTELATTSFNTVSTVTITGLSGYKQLKFYIYASPAVSQDHRMRLNGDTGANYVYGLGHMANFTHSSGATSFALKVSASGQETLGVITVSPANSTTTKKLVMGENFIANSLPTNFHGRYGSSSAITSATFFTSTGNFSEAFVTVWGIN